MTRHTCFHCIVLCFCCYHVEPWTLDDTLTSLLTQLLHKMQCNVINTYVNGMWQLGLNQGCTTQIYWRAKNLFLQYLRAKNDMFLLLHRAFKKNGKGTKSLAVRAKLKASAGRMLCIIGLNTYKFGSLTIQTRDIRTKNLKYLTS